MTTTTTTATQVVVDLPPPPATGAVAAVGSKVKRGAIPDIRRKMLDQGALLFRFEKPHDVVHKREHVVWWEQMEQLGFRVTRSGCILPYDNFCGSSKGRPKGHKISAYFFLGEPPCCQSGGGDGGHPHGWPMQMQVSHRCHRKDCINPSHLVYEPQWKNLKRNYCGEHGSCDCGMQPPCVATYHNGDWQYSDDLVTYSTEGYRKIVTSLVPGRRFVILPADHYESVDIKKRKRNERLQSKRKKSKASASPTPPAAAAKKKKKKGSAKKCKEIK